jgi:hypothetical protein
LSKPFNDWSSLRLPILAARREGFKGKPSAFGSAGRRVV